MLRAGDIAARLTREAGVDIERTVSVLIVPSDIPRDVEVRAGQRLAKRLEPRQAGACPEKMELVQVHETRRAERGGRPGRIRHREVVRKPTAKERLR